MEKCCETCKYRDGCRYVCENDYGCNLMFDDWDDEKDYCSKWEEKEIPKHIELDAILKTDYSVKNMKNDILIYFKQRIEDSINEAQKKVLDFSYKAQVRPQTSEISYKQAFKWILDAKRTTN